MWGVVLALHQHTFVGLMSLSKFHPAQPAYLRALLLFPGSIPITRVQIGETICSKEKPDPLPTIQVEEPTVSMTFKV